ncbi:MAG TPA: AMP-binding protein [Candidatus Limnocylindria bacterium]|nr:AMP-binding protein [Candidatus Limnocylindria bacterium]
MNLPPEQEAIRAKCFHPSGRFVEFPEEDVETSIPERFEKIAARYPDRVAVKLRNRLLTYRELNDTANRLARAILARRGNTQEPIALLMEHDIPLFVAMLGVLKTGKICVVLDPSFPNDRNVFLIEDSQAGLLISDRENLSSAAEYTHGRCGCVNIDELDSSLSIENLRLPIAPMNFAFLIYTSGSTGQPKGVIQNHRNLLHDCLLYCNGLHVCADDRIALLYSCSASQGLKITFAGLLNGAALYPFNMRQRGVADLPLWLNQEEISIYFSVPVVFRQFTSTLTGHYQWPSLRIIQLGSDLVTLRELEEFQKHFTADTILIIRFGATETGTLRRLYVDAKSSLDQIKNAVGYATEEAEISIRDEADGQMKCDVIGEIVVHSRYISPGYWRRPNLHQDPFFPDPNGRGKRIYRTGDLGRLRSDGLLFHLGRKDFQLSIRGYRVEPSEIEAVLLAQDNVKEALVAAGPGDTQAEHDRLVAYIVPYYKPFPSSPVLRRAARQKLPAHMIPSDFVFLESLPLTPNGKVDRLALPAPDTARSEIEMTYAAPRSDIENRLVKIWTEVLSIEHVGIHDNFFDLGGHSLSATRVLSRIFEQYQLEIPLKSLFQSPTIAELAAQIIAHQKNG